MLRPSMMAPRFMFEIFLFWKSARSGKIVGSMKLKYLGYVIFFAIFVVFWYFIRKNISVILTTFNTTVANLTSYIIIAFIFSLVAYLIVAIAYRIILGMVGIKRNLFDALKLELYAMTISVLIPSGGFSAIAVYAEDAEEHGDSKATEISGSLLFILSDYTAISLILLTASIYLFGIGSLTWATFIPSLIFWLITILFYALSWLSTRKHDYLTRKITKLFLWVGRLIKKFTKKKLNAENYAEQFINEFAQASVSVSKNKKKWFRVIGVVLLAHIAKILILYLVFLSFGADVSLRNVLVGYAIGVTIQVLSPTPMGIGFVEAAMGLAYVNLGLSGEIATATVLIYRAIVFWIPFFIGFLVMQGRRIKKITEDIKTIGV
jgi:uncharacterized protein (TIRG00374 family)